MRTYDPMMFGEPPTDLVDDAEALGAYIAQPDLPFLEDNPDNPPTMSDPRGMMKPGAGPAMGPAPVMDAGMQDAPMMGEMGEMGAGDAPIDQEAMQQAILDAQAQYNSSSQAYQDQTVGQNEEDNKKAMMIEEGLA